MVFFQHFFHIEQHCFHLDRQFSCSSNILNWLSRVLNSIYSSHTELLFLRLACTLSKTKWYLLEFIWDSPGRRKLRNNDMDLTVTTNNITDTIEKLLPYQASRIMSVWISPDGTSTLQTEKVREITARWADKLWSSHIRRADTWYFFDWP